MARLCVFCGRPGVTREHALPDWLSDILPGEGSFQVAQTHTSAASTVTRQWSADRLNKTVKRVCGPCNSTWMSDLENAARPILLPLINGQSRTLTFDDQRIVATWAVKTAMMCELGRLEDTDATPATHHREVFERQIPPGGTSVWAAGYRGDKAIGVYQSALHLHSSTGDGLGFVTTMTIGRLLLQTIWFWDYADGIEIQGGWGLPRIWPDPAPSIVLPPATLLADDEVRELAASFLTPTSQTR